MMIGADVGAVGNSAAKCAEIAAHEFDAALIGNAAVFVGRVTVRGAVFGDLDGQTVFLVNAENEVVEAVRPDFPGKIGERAFVPVDEIGDAGTVASWRRWEANRRR